MKSGYRGSYFTRGLRHWRNTSVSSQTCQRTLVPSLPRLHAWREHDTHSLPERAVRAAAYPSQLGTASPIHLVSDFLNGISPSTEKS